VEGEYKQMKRKQSVIIRIRDYEKKNAGEEV